MTYRTNPPYLYLKPWLLLLLLALSYSLQAAEQHIIWSGPLDEKAALCIRELTPRRARVALVGKLFQEDPANLSASLHLLRSHGVRVTEEPSKADLLLFCPSQGDYTLPDLPFSFCSQYDHPIQRKAYQEALLQGLPQQGYALEGQSGLLLLSGKAEQGFTFSHTQHIYQVTFTDSTLHTTQLPTDVFIRPDAAKLKHIRTLDVHKRVSQLPIKDNADTPIEAFIRIKHALSEGKMSKVAQYSTPEVRKKYASLPDQTPPKDLARAHLDTKLLRVFIYKDRIAAVAEEMFSGTVIGLWYFYKQKGEWLSGEEDFGGYCADDAETLFREKVGRR